MENHRKLAGFLVAVLALTTAAGLRFLSEPLVQGVLGCYLILVGGNFGEWWAKARKTQ